MKLPKINVEDYIEVDEVDGEVNEKYDVKKNINKNDGKSKLIKFDKKKLWN